MGTSICYISFFVIWRKVKLCLCNHCGIMKKKTPCNVKNREAKPKQLFRDVMGNGVSTNFGSSLLDKLVSTLLNTYTLISTPISSITRIRSALCCFQIRFM